MCQIIDSECASDLWAVPNKMHLSKKHFFGKEEKSLCIYCLKKIHWGRRIYKSGFKAFLLINQSPNKTTVQVIVLLHIQQCWASFDVYLNFLFTFYLSLQLTLVMKKEMTCCWEILVLIKIINNWRKISKEKEAINKKVCIFFYN